MQKLLLLVLIGLFGSSAVMAMGHMDEDQQAVWSTVAASWEDEASKTGEWPGEYLHEDAKAWGAEWPAPRDAASIESWARFGDENSTTEKYELFPMTVTVSGDTAVAHYGVVQITKSDDETEREMSGLVETLVRTDDGWKFIALTGFEMGDD